MKSFIWDKHFITGISSVDQQHKHLVKITNQFGKHIAENKIVFKFIEAIFKELADYTEYHFQEEEALMQKLSIDKRHYNHHLGVHNNFLNDVTSMYSMLSKDDLDSAKNLLNFLINWLAYHILGSDQNMARQIAAVQSGVEPAKAYETEEREKNSATEPLLIALDGLFEQVSDRNKELIKLNQELEEKVAQRTKELFEANKHLKELSLTDVLTGLPNRRSAMKSLSSLWEKSVQDDLSLVCIMIDADHFKEVNDTYGHDAGDLVLIELAKTLQHSFRNDDIVCRLGGDEFFVICPDTDKDGAMRIAQLTLKTVSELRITTGGKPWHGSVSIGIAHRTPDIKTYEELIKTADKGLYAAKQDGKNCIRTIS